MKEYCGRTHSAAVHRTVCGRCAHFDHNIPPAAAGSARGHTEEGGAAEEAADSTGPPALLREWVARTGAATHAAESRKH